MCAYAPLCVPVYCLDLTHCLLAPEHTHTFQSSFFRDYHVTAETPPPVYDDRSEASGLDNSPVGLPGSFIGSSGENLNIGCIVSYCVSVVYILYGVCVRACMRACVR